MTDLSSLRRDYLGEPLSESESEADPFVQFRRWFAQIRELDDDPTAMALATATREGHPSARMVLLKGVDERGFVFFTNYRSRKGRELGQTRRASLLFYWRPLERQVRIDGIVERLSDPESDAYFSTRPIESRWSAAASPQSDPIADRAELDAWVLAARERYGDHVPRPDWWGGYRVVPHEFEFWQGRASRLHDRLRYRKAGERWIRERLAP